MTVILLITINIYPVAASKNVVFRLKETSIPARAEVIASALSDLEDLTEESVSRTTKELDATGLDRIVITNRSGLCLYDTGAVDNVRGSYALFPEVVLALRGSDVFRCVCETTAFETFAAVPIVSGGSIRGAVYVLEKDTEQAALLRSIRTNMRRLSLLIGGAFLIITFIFSLMYTRRFEKILRAIRIVREGDYSHKIEIHSQDEMGMLAAEFNALTDRITTTETMRRQFVSDASHELKTPLASITLLADSILQNRELMDTDTVMEFVQDIGNEAERLSRMTQKLLQLTKMDSRSEDRLVVVDMAAVVEKVFRILRPLAETRSVCLAGSMDDNCYILANEDDLYQVIFNLAENGVKYNREGGTLQVLLFCREDQATLIVEDEGEGIPEEERERIFERFYRVDKARSRQAGGSGLGLSIVKNTVERYGGVISVMARESLGTRFTVRFPLYSGPAQPGEPPAEETNEQEEVTSEE